MVAASLRGLQAIIHGSEDCLNPSPLMLLLEEARPIVPAIGVWEVACADIAVRVLISIRVLPRPVAATLGEPRRVAASAEDDVALVAVVPRPAVGAAVPAERVVAIVMSEADAVPPAEAHMAGTALAVDRPREPLMGAAVDPRVLRDAGLALRGVLATLVGLLPRQHAVNGALSGGRNIRRSGTCALQERGLHVTAAAHGLEVPSVL
mmetsp:Transcript_121716/g.351402  ORF Transcript_121716/g.351402 Transcript_121716/m.351402 type:complete len:207 (-) Transcript_121716:605-1225(-)